MAGLLISAIEFSAWAYSSRLLSICLKRLGFDNKIAEKATKSLSYISMKASLYIWQARNFSVWSSNTSPVTIKDADIPSTNTAFLSSQPTKNQRQFDQHTKHLIFFNKGNTYCANSILQHLSTIPLFWSQSASELGFLSPLTRAIALNMSL